MEVLKTSRVVYVFQVLCIIETKSRFLLIKYSISTIKTEIYWKTLLKRYSDIRVFCKNPERLLLLKHLLKIKIAVPDKFSGAADRIYFSKFFKNFALIAGKHMCWSLFLVKLQAWIIESTLWFTLGPCFHFRNHTQNNQLIRKHVIEAYQVYCTVLLIYRFGIHFYS